MRLLDNETNKPLTNVSLYLTQAEARQLMGYLEDLLSEGGHHIHLNDEEYARELTLAVYTAENLLQFDEQSRRLITEGTLPQATSTAPTPKHEDIFKRLENAEAEVLHLHEQGLERHRAYLKAAEAFGEAQKRIRSLERLIARLQGNS